LHGFRHETSKQTDCRNQGPKFVDSHRSAKTRILAARLAGRFGKREQAFRPPPYSPPMIKREGADRVVRGSCRGLTHVFDQPWTRVESSSLDSSRACPRLDKPVGHLFQVGDRRLQIVVDRVVVFCSWPSEPSPFSKAGRDLFQIFHAACSRSKLSRPGEQPADGPNFFKPFRDDFQIRDRGAEVRVTLPST
jgi:hypothetical protein